MKKSLLATVAAVAMIAGTGLASAAEGGKDQAAPRAGAEMNKAPDARANTGAKAGAEIKGPQTTGSGVSEKAGADVKAGADTKASADVKGKAASKAEMKSDNKPNTKAENKADATKKPTTTGAGSADKADSKADSKAQMKSDNKGAGAQTSGATADKADTKGASVNLTTEQKTKIRTSVIESKSAPRVSRSSINFNISLGTVVPRTVHYVAVPPTLVEIHPEWRGHMYFVVDEEIIIVDSRGRIVAILDV